MSATDPDALPDPPAAPAPPNPVAVTDELAAALIAELRRSTNQRHLRDETIAKMTAELDATLRSPEQRVIAAVLIPLVNKLAAENNLDALRRDLPDATEPVPPGFEPSPEQRRLLSAAIANPSVRSISEICVLAGVHPSSYYRWCHNPAFRQWMTLAWAEDLYFSGWQHINVARSLAGTHFSYWKAIHDLIFDPRGLGLLQAWQDGASAGRPGAPGPQDGRAKAQAAPQAPGTRAPSNHPGPAPTPSPTRAISFAKYSLPGSRTTRRSKSTK